MKLELGQLGAGGLVEDIKPYDLSPNIFTSVMNVDFDGYSIFPLKAEVETLYPLPQGVIPLAIIQGWMFAKTPVWVAASSTSVYLLYAGQWYDVTPVDFIPTTSWNLFTFNGFIILNCPNNPPYFVNIYDYLTPIQTLTAWPTGIQVKYLTSFEGFLVGLGFTSSDGYYDKQMVFWSDLAEIGQLPVNYNFSDPTSRAGFTLLSDYEGFIVGKLLRNSLIIYRDNSIFEMRFIGGTLVFSFARRVRNATVLNSRCVVEINNLHFFIGKDDFFWFDGLNTQPIGKGQIVKSFFKRADLSTVYLLADSDNQKIYIHYKEKGSSIPLAYVYRIKEQLFIKQEVPSNQAVTQGITPSTSANLTWADMINDWQSTLGTWEVDYSEERLSDFVWVADNTFYELPLDGAYKEAYIERVSMAFFDKDQAGGVTVNRTQRKVVRELWPELSEGTLNIALGASDIHSNVPVYETSQSFSQASDLKQDWFFSTKFLSLKIDNKNTTGNPYYFELTGMGLVLEAGGMY